MKKPKERFLEIMRVELEDLCDDIDELSERSCQKWHQHEITDLGYWGNVGVLKRELRGVGCFTHILDATDPSGYDSLEAMIQDLEARLLDAVRKSDMVPAVDRLICCKIEKARKYVEA